MGLEPHACNTCCNGMWSCILSSVHLYHTTLTLGLGAMAMGVGGGRHKPQGSTFATAGGQQGCREGFFLLGVCRIFGRNGMPVLSGWFQYQFL